ncbi:MAG: hypothetical protein HRT38_16840 [Alteromonadaceae bacterium]|nr:hypothetical protein [Alteromonadaceae bacterium]
MRTIKDVRFELNLWGKFWARQEEGQGYSSKSNVQAIKEACQVGCASSSDLHLFSHRADSIYVPAHITVIDESLERLSPKCITALRQRYVNKGQILYFSNKEIFLFWVKKAERELL